MNTLQRVEALAAGAGLDAKAFLKRLHDPVFFVHQLWIDRGLDSKGPIGPAEEDMIRFATNHRIPKKGLLAPRGIGKTYFICCALTLWHLYRNPETKILHVSKSEGHAKKSLYMIKKWIHEVCFLRHLYAEKTDGCRWSETEMDVANIHPDRTPSVTVAGIDGQLPGIRAAVVFVDDVETPDNTQTASSRDRLADQVKEFSAIASYGNEEVVYVGTYHADESLYIHLNDLKYIDPDSGKEINLYPFRTWPVMYPTTEEERQMRGFSPQLKQKMQDNLAQAGDLVFPKRMNRDLVAKRQGEGKSYFARQYMLLADTDQGTKYPLHLRDLVVFDCKGDEAPHTIKWGTSDGRGYRTDVEDIQNLGFEGDRMYAPIMFDEKWAKYEGTKMWIDPSGQGVDHTAWAIVSMLNGYLYVRKVESDQNGYEQSVLKRICQDARDFRVNDVYAEKNFGQDMFMRLLEPEMAKYFLPPTPSSNGWACNIVRDPSKGWSRTAKEQHIIDSLEGLMNRHRVIVDPDVLKPNSLHTRDFQLQYQLTHITRDRDCIRHDDKVDALASCVAMWKDDVMVDTELLAELHKDRARKQMIADWWKGEPGYKEANYLDCYRK